MWVSTYSSNMIINVVKCVEYENVVSTYSSNMIINVEKCVEYENVGFYK